MSNTEFTGYLIVYGLIMLSGLMAVIKPIINLNVNIQKLSDAINQLATDSNALKRTVEDHEDKLNDHETRISIIESRNQQKTTSN